MASAKAGNGNGSNGSMIPLASAATVIMLLLQSLSWLGWSVTNASLERLEKRIQLVEMQFMRVREHEEFTKRLDAQITKIEARMGVTATREELDTRLGINSNSIIQVRNEVDGLKRDLGQTYPLKEVLGSLGARLDRMEQWSRAPPPSAQRSGIP